MFTDQDRLAWERRQKHTTLCGDQNVLFQANEAGGGRHAQLQSEDVASLDSPLCGRAVAGPARPEPRATVVYRAGCKPVSRTKISQQSRAVSRSSGCTWSAFSRSSMTDISTAGRAGA
jgi:hypothetical protein